MWNQKQERMGRRYMEKVLFSQRKSPCNACVGLPQCKQFVDIDTHRASYPRRPMVSIAAISCLNRYGKTIRFSEAVNVVLDLFEFGPCHTRESCRWFPKVGWRHRSPVSPRHFVRRMMRRVGPAVGRARVGAKASSFPLRRQADCNLKAHSRN